MSTQHHTAGNRLSPPGAWRSSITRPVLVSFCFLLGLGHCCVEVWNKWQSTLAILVSCSESSKLRTCRRLHCHPPHFQAINICVKQRAGPLLVWTANLLLLVSHARWHTTEVRRATAVLQKCLRESRQPQLLQWHSGQQLGQSQASALLWLVATCFQRIVVT